MPNHDDISNFYHVMCCVFKLSVLLLKYMHANS